MRASFAIYCLIAALALPVAHRAWAQTDEQQLSAEEFLSLDDATNVEGATPPTTPPPNGAAAPAPDGTVPTASDAPADASVDADAAKAAEVFGDGQRKRQMSDRSIVKLRTIDKLSARTHTFDIPVSKTVKFGKSLFIKARACRSASQLDEPENAAFLQIWERLPAPDARSGDESRWIFSGWMFSSSPSLSAMEHPIYDVWVIECKNDATAAAAETYSAETVPATAPEDAAAAAPATKDDDAGDAPKDGEEKPAVTEEKPATPAVAQPAPEQMAPVSPVSGGSAAVPTLQELPGSFEDGE